MKILAEAEENHKRETEKCIEARKMMNKEFIKKKDGRYFLDQIYSVNFSKKASCIF